MKRLLVAIAVVTSLLSAFATVALADVTITQTELCPLTDFDPDTGGWVKVDGLDGFSYTFPNAPSTFVIPDGFTVITNCAKRSTMVEYGTGRTVTSPDEHELSHASFHLVPPEPTTTTTEPTTTTTDPGTTTTTEPATTTTTEPTTTTTDPGTTTTTTEAVTTTSAIADTTTTAGATTTDTLPLTGIDADDLLPVALGLSLAGMIALGGTAVWSARATTHKGE
jgi:hypothetical protein